MIKYLILLLFVVSIVSCGKSEAVGTNTTTIVPTSGPFAGYYVFPNGGYASIVSDPGSLQTVNPMRIVGVNADGSTNVLPNSSASNLPVVNSQLFTNANQTYDVSRNVKMDSNNSLLVGTYLTELTFSRLGAALLIRTQIISGAIVVYDHTIVSQ